MPTGMPLKYRYWTAGEERSDCEGGPEWGFGIDFVSKKSSSGNKDVWNSSGCRAIYYGVVFFLIVCYA